MFPPRVVTYKYSGFRRLDLTFGNLALSSRGHPANARPTS